ncbi:hypothetical protein [Synechococcus sp. CBW1108]|uniref:hypothetical protein n=1 Tax=Synechococcus sp. CBW1108 TaxID=1353147 RepID=UPI0018CF5280|nr:hypothetical protein [Synechococcus sp. CBW1108]QPN70094.1 hypothetical protein H8F27_16995 [Synechococcus sp. CBW1108]
MTASNNINLGNLNGRSQQASRQAESLLKSLDGQKAGSGLGKAPTTTRQTPSGLGGGVNGNGQPPQAASPGPGDRKEDNLASENALALVQFLESHGPSEDLVMQASQHYFRQPTTVQKQEKPWKKVYGLVGVLPEDVRGKHAVSESLRGSSRITAVLLTLSSWIDLTSSVGLFSFVFRLAPGGALLWGPFTAGILLLMSNKSGRAMVDRHNNKKMANVATVVFASVAAFQTGLSGVGVFLFSGQDQVVNHKAEQVINGDLDRRRRLIEGLQNPTNPAFHADAKACEANTARLSAMGSRNPAYQQLSVETFGRWDDRRVAPTNKPRWVLQQTPLDRWPICSRAAAKEGAIQAQLSTEVRELASLEKKLQNTPNKVAFLRQEQPKVFEQHFVMEPNGSVAMRSATEAFGAAVVYFIWPPEGARNNLLLSYVIMGLSILTSSAAFFSLLTQARSDKTKMSFEAACGQQRSLLLSRIRERLPEDADVWFQRQRSVQRRRGAAQKEGYTAAQVSNLNPEFQTLASLLKTGNEEVRCEAQEQYWEHLIDLYIMRSSETGDIDYGYLSNRLERFWHDFKATKNSRVASSGWMGPEAS